MGKRRTAPKKESAGAGALNVAPPVAMTELPGITLSPGYFAQLWEYFDRRHGFVSDPRQMGDIMKLGDRLWQTLREAAEEQGCSLPIRHDPVASLPPPGRADGETPALRVVH